MEPERDRAEDGVFDRTRLERAEHVHQKVFVDRDPLRHGVSVTWIAAVANPARKVRGMRLAKPIRARQARRMQLSTIGGATLGVLLAMALVLLHASTARADGIALEYRIAFRIVVLDPALAFVTVVEAG